MPRLGIAGFDGVVPRTSPTMLGDSQAQQADNVKLYARELRYWRGAKRDTQAAAGTQTIYKQFGPGGASRWLTWTTLVDAVPGPSADTSDYRLYLTGMAGGPKKTNWALAAGGTYYDMGVPAPASAPAVVEAAGTATAPDTRAYVVTFVSTFGALKEESAPSPASITFTVNAGKAAQVTLPASPGGATNITHVRVYRTVTGTSAVNYAFVAELPVGTLTYIDDLKAGQLGAALPSIGWAPPVSGLTGLVSLAGGALAGFAGNTVYFSEPYYPHAWPLKYAMNVPYPIVGLGAYGSTLVVLTELYPYVITGTVPGSMSMEKLPLTEPCVSRRSIVADEFGVTYASPNGLVAVAPDGTGLTTTKLFRRDEWQSYVPATLVSAVFEGRYFGFYQSPTHGSRAMVLARDDIPALCFFDAAAVTCHVDTRNAKLYFLAIADGWIYEADADEQNPFTYQWKSKRFVFPQAVSWSVLKVDADYGAVQNVANYNANVAAIIAANQALWSGNSNLRSTFNQRPLNSLILNGSILAPVPQPSTARAVQVLVYGDGALVAQKTLTSLDPVRLPPFKNREFEFKIVGNTPVRSIAVATSVQELRT